MTENVKVYEMGLSKDQIDLIVVLHQLGQPASSAEIYQEYRKRHPNSPLTKSDFADSVRIGGQFGANRDDDGSGERSAR